MGAPGLPLAAYSPYMQTTGGLISPALLDPSASAAAAVQQIHKRNEVGYICPLLLTLLYYAAVS